MTKIRSAYRYRLTGIIQEKKTKKDRAGFKLTVILPNQPHLTALQVFQDKLTNPQIWPALITNHYLGKQCLFICQNYFGQYHLIDWEELPPKETNSHERN